MSNDASTPQRCERCGVITPPRRYPVRFCGYSCGSASKAKPVAVRFWLKVDRSGPNACWLWTASTFEGGYGKFRANQPRRTLHAHRVAWELTNGPVPDGLCVLHNCPGGDNPRCCNPAHLWLGTQLDNVADRHAKGRDGGGDVRNFRGRRPDNRGERAGRAKLTWDIVRHIRRTFTGAYGEVTALAREYGVDASTMSNVIHRKIWHDD